MTQYHQVLLGQYYRFIEHGFVVATVTAWGLSDVVYLGRLRFDS